MYDWAEWAACAGADPEIFFPARGHSTRAAQLICAGCPVIAQCAQAAADGRELYGVWGGMAEGERRRLRNRRASA
jgi:WhiB family redox-sensing transcriptional regulator